MAVEVVFGDDGGALDGEGVGVDVLVGGEGEVLEAFYVEFVALADSLGLGGGVGIGGIEMY